MKRVSVFLARALAVLGVVASSRTAGDELVARDDEAIARARREARSKPVTVRVGHRSRLRLDLEPVYYVLGDGAVVSTILPRSDAQTKVLRAGGARLLTRAERRRIVGARAWRVLGIRAPETSPVQLKIGGVDVPVAWAMPTRGSYSRRARLEEKRLRLIWAGRPT